MVRLLRLEAELAMASAGVEPEAVRVAEAEADAVVAGREAAHGDSAAGAGIGAEEPLRGGGERGVHAAEGWRGEAHSEAGWRACVSAA